MVQDSDLAYSELPLEQLTEQYLNPVGRTGAPVTERGAYSKVRYKVDHTSIRVVPRKHYAFVS